MRSEAQFGVRAKADQAERLRVWLLVDEYEVRFQVTVAEVGPLATECMVTLARVQPAYCR